MARRASGGHRADVIVTTLSERIVRARAGETANVGTGKLVREFEACYNGVNAVAFLPGGLMAVTAGNDRALRTWRVNK